MSDLILNNNVLMPQIGLGTYELQGKFGIDLMVKALNFGYRLIDTAHMYDNEKEVCIAINNASVKREDLFITSKLNSPYNSYLDAIRGVKESLKNMNLQYIDLYLVHEPYSNFIEMYKALEEM